ncbi:LGFP repeat-containing protein [Amycolatopsis sp. A1MSW2902]|uniref:LGFP repeat-containing protein n=1 Tax=Amycolatopsis sp. A1MSW2902 TaxID=687413 RepID=UPI00307EA7F3
MVQGMIRQTWRQRGWEQGALGSPTTDEQPTADGWIQRFGTAPSSGTAAPTPPRSPSLAARWSTTLATDGSLRPRAAPCWRDQSRA